MKERIDEDLKRARQALESAERNLKENDLLTAANRNFIACENAIYVLLKSKFGSSTISRMKILTRLREVSSKAKETYDSAYDLRVQADYGRKARLFPLNQENLEKSIREVKEIVEKASEIINKKFIL
ncbi:HEPN domain-containing protein [Candidatus Woesearchaeota archaeon]|nr:HEPN domain-containing protein [Candidatus Woesearchaeota archaeon]